MQINGVSSSSFASAVWAALTRTLTADPATDAVAGSVVWNHVGRSLSADPATDAGAATLVWNHGARSITADPATDAVAGNVIWGHGARSLTVDPATAAGAGAAVWNYVGGARSISSLFQSGCSVSGTASGTLAAVTVLDLRTPANKMAWTFLTYSVNTGGLGQSGIYDGVTFQPGPNVSPSTAAQSEGVGGNAVGFSFKNAGGSGTITYGYVQLLMG